MKQLEKHKDQIIKAAEYITDGCPMKDVLDDYEIMDIIIILAAYLKHAKKEGL